MTTQDVLFEDLLDALMLEESEPSYAALARWSARYPEHREALAAFFATWAVQVELPQETVVDEEQLANLAVRKALNIVYRQDGEARQAPDVKSNRTSLRLIAAARAAGTSVGQLAASAGLDQTIIQKLDLRRLTKIPSLCYERIASALSTTPARVQQMVSGQPILAAGVRHKTTRRPILTTEDFGVAIRNSSLSEEAKRFWLESDGAELENGEA